MNLLLFINSLSAGGAERVLAKLADYFVEQGHNVTLVTQTTADTDHYQTRARRESLAAGEVSRNALHALGNNLKRLRRLRACIRNLQPDCVVAFMPTANVLALMVAGSVPVIVSERVHPPYLELSTARQWLQRLFYPRAASVVVLNAASATWFADHYGLRNTVVIPNSISLPLPLQEPIIEPADVVAQDVRVVLSVGRLVAQKRPEMVLAAFAQVADPTWHLVLIGKGDKADTMLQLAEQLGIAHRFTLLNRVGNVQTWYERADVYVSASSYEGFPNALLEAMACGCACLSFDCPTGPADIISHNVNGLLLPMAAEAEFAQSLQDLCSNRALRERLAGQAVQAAERFADTRVLPLWQDVVRNAAR